MHMKRQHKRQQQTPDDHTGNYRWLKMAYRKNALLINALHTKIKFCLGHKGPFPLRAWKKAFFVCFIAFFFALASILTPRFNRRSIKERKNALFHARSGNGP